MAQNDHISQGTRRSNAAHVRTCGNDFVQMLLDFYSTVLSIATFELLHQKLTHLKEGNSSSEHVCSLFDHCTGFVNIRKLMHQSGHEFEE